MDKELETKTIAEVKPDHILQAATYAVLLNKKSYRLVYVSKDDLCIKEFCLSMNEHAVNCVTNEVSKMRSFTTLPPPEPRLYGKDKNGKPKECQWCPYKDKCNSLVKEHE